MADIKFDNPNFNKEKYGKYFDDEGKIKDMRGWLDARNNDLKSASDPADLVNKINNQNQYGNEKYDKFFRNYGNFLRRERDGIFDDMYDDVINAYRFDEDKRNELKNVYENNRHLDEEQAKTEFVKEYLKAEFENKPKKELFEALLDGLMLDGGGDHFKPVASLVNLLQELLDADE